MSYQLTTAKIWDGAAWQDATGGGLALAKVSGTPTGTFTDSNGFEWEYHLFTSNGSITVTEAGYADCLIVGGGGSGNRNGGANGAGGAGGVKYGMIYLPAGTHPITIGAGGSGSGVSSGNPGSETTLGSIERAGGGGSGYGFPTGGGGFTGWGGGHTGGKVRGTTGTYFGGGAGGTPSNHDGLTLNYTGSSVEYGRGGTSSTPLANAGWGGDVDIDGGAGSNGVVIVKVIAQ